MQMDGNFAPRSGREGHQKGFLAEQLFYEAFHNYPVVLPGWLYKMERATEAEDHQGVDAWAYTRHGRIPIQIKSSARCAREYREKHGDCSHVVTLIVSLIQTPEQIRAMTVTSLRAHFKHLERVQNCKRRTARV